MCRIIFRVEVPRWDSPRIFHHTMLRISSSCTDSRSKTSWQIEVLVLHNSAALLNTSLCSGILPVSIGFNLQEDEADDGSPRAGRPPKTCPDAPNEFRTVRQARIAADHSSRTRNTPKLTANVGHSRVAHSFRIITFSCIIKEFTLSCKSLI